MNTSQKYSKRGLGFTLIEILVVVSILGILTALLIPRLRTVSKERNIRESARIVGSVFAQASQRAVADGIAGVLLEREGNNDNFVINDPIMGNYEYGVTRLSLLRKVPDYVGDQQPTVDRSIFGYGATKDTAGTAVTARIPKPIEQDDQKIVEVGDFISFNYSSVQYRILAVAEFISPENSAPFLDLTLHLGQNDVGDNAYLPDPGGADGFLPDEDYMDMASVPPGEPFGFEPGLPFVVRRSPRKLRSSTVELPRGYIIDLRFSGFAMLDSGFFSNSDGIRSPFITNVIEPYPRVFVTLLNGALQVVRFSQSDIAFLFDDQGKIDRMVSRAPYDFNLDGINDTFATFERTPSNAVNLFVTEVETDLNINPLAKDTNLWVTISSGSGAVNVGYNNPLGDSTLVPPIVPADYSLVDLSNLYNDDDDASGPISRAEFSTVLNQARNDARIGTASQ